MKRRLFLIPYASLLLFCMACSSQHHTTGNTKKQTNNPLPDWAMGGFVRPAGINPVISPNPSSMFTDPMTGKPVAWESNDTFNPGATV
ncbi:MAG TPA: hypothetical protein VFL47_08805, partial [Flavisolibacter sp.]|nr:hypothetical protein [Flavisolibacter sp.]